MAKKIKIKIFFEKRAIVKKIDEGGDISLENLISEIVYTLDGSTYNAKVKYEGARRDVIFIEGFEPIFSVLDTQNKKTIDELKRIIRDKTDGRDQINVLLEKSEAPIYSDYESLITFGEYRLGGRIGDKEILSQICIDPDKNKKIKISYLVTLDFLDSIRDAEGNFIPSLVDLDESMIYSVQSVDI